MRKNRFKRESRIVSIRRGGDDGDLAAGFGVTTESVSGLPRAQPRHHNADLWRRDVYDSALHKRADLKKYGSHRYNNMRDIADYDSTP
jgi:hypothetical protein